MIYDDKFHNRRAGRSYYQEIANATRIIFKYSSLRARQDKYNSVLDIGCSCGALLNCFDLPVKHGIDFGVSPDNILKNAGIYHDVDLSREHVNLGIGFDLVISLEVVEHIFPSQSSNIFSTMTSNSAPHSTLIFSGAREGQRGRHHVNCKNSHEWLAILTSIGYNYSAPMTNNMISEIGSKIPDCYRSNIMIFNYGA